MRKKSAFFTICAAALLVFKGAYAQSAPQSASAGNPPAASANAAFSEEEVQAAIEADPSDFAGSHPYDPLSTPYDKWLSGLADSAKSGNTHSEARYAFELILPHDPDAAPDTKKGFAVLEKLSAAKSPYAAALLADLARGTPYGAAAKQFKNPEKADALAINAAALGSAHYADFAYASLAGNPSALAEFLKKVSNAPHAEPEALQKAFLANLRLDTTKGVRGCPCRNANFAPEFDTPPLGQTRPVDSESARIAAARLYALNTLSDSLSSPLRHCLLNGIGGEADAEKAAEISRQIYLNAKDPSEKLCSALHLAYAYENGAGASQNPKLAEKFFSSAFENCDHIAVQNLCDAARRFRAGYAVPRSPAFARKIMTRLLNEKNADYDDLLSYAYPAALALVNSLSEPEETTPESRRRTLENLFKWSCAAERRAARARLEELGCPHAEVPSVEQLESALETEEISDKQTLLRAAEIARLFRILNPDKAAFSELVRRINSMVLPESVSEFSVSLKVRSRKEFIAVIFERDGEDGHLSCSIIDGR